MQPEDMPGYAYPTLAVWPEYWLEGQLWQIHEYKLKNDGSLRWYQGYTTNGVLLRADVHPNFEAALEVAKIRNYELSGQVSKLGFSHEINKSITLKVEKAILSKSRLANEERLMLAEAVNRHRGDPRSLSHELKIPDTCELLREPLFALLNEMPYLEIVYIKTFGTVLSKIGNNHWSKISRNKASIRSAHRAKIANGFGLSSSEHWGKTKASIRELLLPRANQLLKLASVKRMLDSAISQGQKVLVADGFVFWFEESGGVGWQVKAVSSSGATDTGNTLWQEGTIISKNHGRIVVLPYIKENNSYTKGHTKNAPNDGKALPRHSNDYVELPFKVLDGDLMIGLFGELHYE
jgi:hypothetical protein